MNHLNTDAITEHKNDDNGHNAVTVDNSNSKFDATNSSVCCCVLCRQLNNVVALLLPCCIAAGCSPFITCTITKAESVKMREMKLVDA